VIGPAGDQPPLHIHRDSDEAFYVLEGELTLWIGDEVHVLRAGDSVIAPRGVPHTLRNGDGGARSLVASTPASFESFVRAVGATAPGPRSSPRSPPTTGSRSSAFPGMLPSDLATAAF
jgi:glyoxylate utilization-related uncharacterized protein